MRIIDFKNKIDSIPGMRATLFDVIYVCVAMPKEYGMNGRFVYRQLYLHKKLIYDLDDIDIKGKTAEDVFSLLEIIKKLRQGSYGNGSL